jgi:hypothetical protein
MDDLNQEVIVEVVDIAEFADRDEDAPSARRYRVRIDDEVHHVDTSRPSGELLLALVHKRECAYELVAEFRHHENFVLKPGESVNLQQRGLRGFLTAHRDVVIITIAGEESSTEREFSIDRGEHSVSFILALVGKTSEGFDLLEERDGPPMPLPAGKPLNIVGCEKFYYQVKSGGSS